jgi:Protein kinase domain
MNEFEDEEPGFSLDDLPLDFGQPKPTASDAKNFPAIPGYRITALLGQGGMGAVYSAIKLDELSRTVAIKTIFLHRFQTIAEANRKRFDREMELLGKLQHPNIVPILEQGSYEREYQIVPYFTMPLLERGDLADALERAPIKDRQDLINWIDSLCCMLEGLTVAHRSGIVHRDIKPRNLFVGADGGLLLGDFGLAKILQDDSELTSTIGRMGTTPYAPPEQLLSAKLADSRADIYAIGVILYQFSCYGIRPFAPDEGSGKSSSETDSIARWQRSKDRTSPRPSLRLKHLSDPSLDFIVQKCLAYYPEHRYQSVEDLLTDLRAWRRGELVRASFPERLRKDFMAPMVAHLLPIIIGAALLLAAGVMAVWYKYSAMTENISTLEADVRSERQKQLDTSSKTEAALRVELKSILPRLEGEEQDFNVRRMTDPKSEFKRLNERAQVIAHELSLEESSNFADRHSYWVIYRTAVQPTLSDGFVEHIRHLLDYAQASLQKTRSEGEDSAQQTATSDLLRTHRLLLNLAWKIVEYSAQDDYRDILDADKVIQESRSALQSMMKLEIVEKVPALRRHLKLLQLEIDLKAPAVTPEDLIAICRDHQNEFTADALKADGCVELHPWYLAWYIFELYFETSKKLEYPTVELQKIVTDWHEVQVATPALKKTDDQNIVYLKDLSVVDDRRGDVLRELGQLPEARDMYETNWIRSAPVRAFCKTDPAAWDVSEQTLSSLIILAEREGNTKDQLLNYVRRYKLLREKLAYANSNPEVFSEIDVSDTKYDLAASLFRQTRLLEANERYTLLAEAKSLLQEVLKASPKHPKARGLQDAIKSLMNQ